ncbi:MAG: redox-sensitive transcriptional activator SoxR [Alteromonadaceae bacterium]|nr:redox-sensitive transcriptional activator SoxR [Alteromonadaceae bacterium]
MTKLREANLTVGMVAKRTGVAVSALHFYEKKELIHSIRNTGNQRRYHRDVIRRVSIIKAAQKLGISLTELALLFEALPEKRTPNKDDWSKISTHWRDLLDIRIKQMIQLRDKIDYCIGCGCLSLKKCQIYNEDDVLADEGEGAHLLFTNDDSDGV